MTQDDHANPNDPARGPIDTRSTTTPPPPPPGYVSAGYAPPPPRQRGVLAKIATSVIASILLLSLLANLYLGMIVVTMTSGPSEATWREGDKTQRIVIVPIDGVINDDMARYIHDTFKALAKNQPRAVVLRVNSGGGGVSPSDQIWHTISSFKAEHPEVKIVASFGGIAASGGYYVAAPADYIFCETTGITGSIGVIAQVPALGTMLEKMGIEMNTVVADGSEEKANANNLFGNWRNDEGELTAQGKENRAVIKDLLNNAWRRFVEVVDQGRPNLNRDEVTEIASGEIYTAQEAVEVGLVNAVGYLDEAIAKAGELAGLAPDADPRVTIIRRPGGLGLLGLIGARRGDGMTLGDLDPDTLRTWLAELGQLRLAYRVSFN